MSRNFVIISIVILLLIVVGGWLLMRPKQSATITTTQPTETPVASESASPIPATATSGAMMKQEGLVKITASGFLPKNITIKVGSSVTWENTDSANHTVSSDNHPTHLLYPFLNLGIIKPGTKKSVTPPKVGSFTYHDHLNPSLTGIVTVQ